MVMFLPLELIFRKQGRVDVVRGAQNTISVRLFFSYPADAVHVKTDSRHLVHHDCDLV